MGVAAAERTKEKDKRKEKLLKLLTYEVVNGKPIYYRGYKDVLAGKKTPEEVMGSSTLQAFVVKRLIVFLVQNFEGKGYEVLPHEVGIVVGKGSRRSLDIAVFKKGDVDISEKYADVPPVVAIEVDVKAEVESEGDLGYIIKKSWDLLDFGVKRVVWILTSPRSVLIFEPNGPAVILNWEDEFEVWEGVKVRLSDLLKT